MYSFLTTLTVCVHFAFLLFVVGGGLLARPAYLAAAALGLARPSWILIRASKLLYLIVQFSYHRSSRSEN